MSGTATIIPKIFSAPVFMCGLLRLPYNKTEINCLGYRNSIEKVDKTYFFLLLFVVCFIVCTELLTDNL